MEDKVKEMGNSLDELLAQAPKDLPKITDIVQFEIDKFNHTSVPSPVCQCKLCGNKGLIAYRKDDDTIGYKKCSCYQIRRNREKIKELGLFHYLVNYPKIDKLPEDEEWERRTKEQLKLFLDKYSDNAWLYLGGQNGSGKTTKATIVLYELVSKYPNKNVAYFNWDIDYRKLIPKHDKKTNDIIDTEIMEYLKEVDILYIDDFARHRSGNWYDSERDIAKELIDYRYLHRKQTIITSELYYKELRQLDEAIAGRIVERCGGQNMFAMSIKRDSKRDYRERNTFDDEGLVI